MYISKVNVAAVIAALMVTTPLQAASVKYAVTAQADDASARQPDGSSSDFDEQRTSSPVALSSNLSVSSNASDGAANSGASLFANAATGTFKMNASSVATTGNGFNPRANSSARSNFEVSETFTTTGIGSVTFLIDIDGYLSESESGDGFFTGGSAIAASTLGRLSNGPAASDSTSSNTATLGLGNFFFEDTLSFTLDVLFGQSIDFFLDATATSGASITGPASQSSASADFLNTLTVRYETTGDLQLLASDPAFLAGPSISAVPLPTSLPLLAGAFGLVGALRLRRRTRRHDPNL